MLRVWPLDWHLPCEARNYEYVNPCSTISHPKAIVWSLSTSFPKVLVGLGSYEPQARLLREGLKIRACM